MKRDSVKSTPWHILLVDDEVSQLKLYSHLFSKELKARFQSTKFPTEALALAEKKLFDVVIIDVTIEYNGSPFGGLELYKQLVGRYGTDSIVVYSKFITEELLRRYNYPFNFVETEGDALEFAKEMARKVDLLRRRQKCFVAMPFGKEQEPLWRVIAPVIRSAHFEPIRVDKQRFNSSITEQIFRELREAKLVLFVTTGRNPNVFYEAGFANALSKEVITVTDSFANLPFDVRDRNAIEYGGDLIRLQKVLAAKLKRIG